LFLINGVLTLKDLILATHQYEFAIRYCWSWYDYKYSCLYENNFLANAKLVVSVCSKYFEIM